VGARGAARELLAGGEHDHEGVTETALADRGLDELLGSTCGQVPEPIVVSGVGGGHDDDAQVVVA